MELLFKLRKKILTCLVLELPWRSFHGHLLLEIFLCFKGYLSYNLCVYDAPLNSLKDSNASPKVKITKKEIGAHSLVCSTSRVRGACWSSRMGTGTNDKCVNYSYQFAQTKQIG